MVHDMNAILILTFLLVWYGYLSLVALHSRTRASNSSFTFTFIGASPRAHRLLSESSAGEVEKR